VTTQTAYAYLLSRAEASAEQAEGWKKDHDAATSAWLSHVLYNDAICLVEWALDLDRRRPEDRGTPHRAKVLKRLLWLIHLAADLVQESRPRDYGYEVEDAKLEQARLLVKALQAGADLAPAGCSEAAQQALERGEVLTLEQFEQQLPPRHP